MNPEQPTITSLGNPRIKGVVKLRKRRERDRRGLTVIEEPPVIARALDAGYPLETVFFCREQLQTDGARLLEALVNAGGAEVIETTAPVMTKISYRDQPEGLLAVAPQIRIGLDDLGLPTTEPALLLVLEGVEKPGNLGAVIRSADGAGAHAVLVCGTGTDIFNPNVLRASRGTFFSVPVVEAETRDILAFLGRKGIAAVATSPASPEPWTAVDLAGPVAILLGAEHEGLSHGLISKAARTVSIPMLGAGDSLNLAASTAILLYEAVRQRSGPDNGSDR